MKQRQWTLYLYYLAILYGDQPPGTFGEYAKEISVVDLMRGGAVPPILFDSPAAAEEQAQRDRKLLEKVMLRYVRDTRTGSNADEGEVHALYGELLSKAEAKRKK